MIERWIPFALTFVILLGEIPSFRTRTTALQKDAGSYWIFALTLAAGCMVSFCLFIFQTMPPTLALGTYSLWLGVALNLLGTALRIWAILTLGHYFTVIVHASPDQKVVETGPYRLLRHPAYSGTAMALIGVGFSMQNLAPVLLIGVSFFVGVSYRIRVEERALEETIGEAYRDYMKRTKRLIPYVY